MSHSLLSNKKNLLQGCTWSNIAAAPYTNYTFSINGECFRRNLVAPAGGTLTGFASKLVQGKLYLAQQDYQNLTDAVAYPGLGTSLLHDSFDGQVLINDGGMNGPLGTVIKTSLTLCYNVTTNLYYRTKSSSAGQSFRVIRPVLYEDMNWTKIIS